MQSPSFSHDVYERLAKLTGILVPLNQRCSFVGAASRHLKSHGYVADLPSLGSVRLCGGAGRVTKTAKLGQSFATCSAAKPKDASVAERAQQT